MKPAAGQDVDRVLVRVGVEVTREERPGDAAVGLELVGEVTSAVACATRSGLALPWPVPSSAPGALGLEVVDDHREAVGAGRADPLEGLGQRLACVGERRAADQDLGGTDERDVGRLVDEAGADHVLVGQGRQVAARRRGGEGPLAGRRCRVQRVDQLGDREVAGLAELGGVLELLEGDDVGVGGVDRRDDLVALPVHVGRVRRATRAVAAGGDGLPQALVVVWRPRGR